MTQPYIYMLKSRKTTCQALEKLSAAMVNISNWLANSCLHLNVDKTVRILLCYYMSKSANSNPDPDVTVEGRRLSVVQEFKYLGIIIDSKLTFKTQVKIVPNKLKFNLSNLRHIRNYLTTEASKLSFHAMIFSHINYSYQLNTGRTDHITLSWNIF